MEQNDPKNPHMADMFRTALAAAAPPPRHDTPSIVVTGSHNVISLGGTVYMADPPGQGRNCSTEDQK